MSSRIEFPAKLQCLFRPARYKVLYGGRGGAKSWGVARALLIQAAAAPLRVLCAREFQNSITDSVHKLLADQIDALGLQAAYDVQERAIVGRNGSEFRFAGLHHNITSIKSFEGVDRCWVEEAQTVSKASWDVLVPTIRKPDSEIWITFNPMLEEDETYQRFVAQPPTGAMVERVNWSDNPWFPDVLRQEMLDLKARDPDSYLNVWEGHCRQTLDGAVYAREIREAMEQSRVTRVPYDPTKPVDTFWDLGWADNTTIWFAQAIGFEYRLIDYHSDSQRSINHYIEVLQKRGYIYGKDWLPHDAQSKQLGSGRSIEEIMRAAGRRVMIVPRLSVEDGINAARTVFPNCWFDAEKCADGLQCLRHYRYEVDEDTKTFKRRPLHDWACFSGETKVLTRNGSQAIRTLPRNGEVLTPCGWKQYTNAGITGTDAPLVEVEFAGGYTVRCTPEHLFLTAEGWRSADHLQTGSLIRSSLTRSRSISMAACTASGRAKDTLRAAANIFTGWFGRVPLEQFLKAAISTTETAIGRITNFRISNACLQTSTCPSLGTSGDRGKTSTSRRPPVRRPPSGIDRKKGDCGIVAILSGLRAGQNGSESRAPASFVGRNITRSFGPMGGAQDTAARYANPLRVVRVSRLAERATVYCLTVPEGAWFTLENGAVVHNSHGADGFRYLAVSLKGKPAIPADKWRRQAAKPRNSWMAA